MIFVKKRGFRKVYGKKFFNKKHVFLVKRRVFQESIYAKNVLCKICDFFVKKNVFAKKKRTNGGKPLPVPKGRSVAAAGLGGGVSDHHGGTGVPVLGLCQCCCAGASPTRATVRSVQPTVLLAHFASPVTLRSLPALR